MKIVSVDHSQKTIPAAIGCTTEEFDALKDKLKKFIKDNYKKEPLRSSYFIEGLLKEFSYSEVILVASFYCSNLIEDLEKKKAEKEKSYDKFGDADPQRIYDHIMGEREGQKGKELLGLIRAFPMPIKGTFEPNEEEMFGATDDSGVKVFMNSAGIKKQVAYVKEKQEILKGEAM